MYVKDEGANLTKCPAVVSSVVNCGVLRLEKPYGGTCFGYVMSKVCQYGTNSNVVCASMTHMSLKSAQPTL